MGCRTVCTADQNRAFLLQRFQRVLLECEPKSLLDVGCGGGALLRMLAEAGVPGIGVEPSLEAADAAPRDVDVRPGSAYRLPFEDGAFDWVVLRHVPHHLEEPARAFAEAVRVAGRGVLIAEPWFETGLASQRTALALDLWEKERDRDEGRFHGPVLGASELLELLPSDPGAELEVELRTHLRLRCRSLDAFEREARGRLEGLAPDHPARSGLESVLATARHTGLTWNGSLLLIARRKGARGAR